MQVSPLHGAVRLWDKVVEIVDALANRLTAADNFGPEGEVGQFLGSNGPNIPPSYKDIETVITSSPEIVEAIKGDPGPPGSAGADGIAGTDGMVPLVIADGETFTIPANKQALWTEPVTVEAGGELVIDGAFTMVT